MNIVIFTILCLSFSQAQNGLEWAFPGPLQKQRLRSSFFAVMQQIRKYESRSRTSEAVIKIINVTTSRTFESGVSTEKSNPMTEITVISPGALNVTTSKINTSTENTTMVEKDRFRWLRKKWQEFKNLVRRPENGRLFLINLIMICMIFTILGCWGCCHLCIPQPRERPPDPEDAQEHVALVRMPRAMAGSHASLPPPPPPYEP